MSGKGPKNNKFPCPNNDGVVCWYKERPCATCGWNPEVEKNRMKKILSGQSGRKFTNK